MDDYKRLEFIQLQSTLGREQFTGFEHEGLEGISCLNCRDGCPGFARHPWRRGCGNCKCGFWEHELPDGAGGHPFDRICFEETMPALTSEYDNAKREGYAWVPRGLRSAGIANFMEQLPSEKVPSRRGDSGSYRVRQLFYQLPRQDFSPKYAKFLKEEAKPSFLSLSEERALDGVGIAAVRGILSMSKQCNHCRAYISSGESGVFTERGGSSICWHPQCFVCNHCQELLVDHVYFFRNGQVYCGRHYSEMKKPRCGGCDELIYVGELTKAIDKSWHIEHFACYHCDVPLTGKKYIINKHQPFCQRCFTENIAHKCYSCKKPIGPDSKDMFVKDKHYHKECLVCSKCHSQLESQTFVYVNNELVCNRCRGTEPPRVCAGCNRQFLPEEKKIGVKENNEYYHELCFLCSRCNLPIGTQKFVRTGPGTQTCNSCYQSNLQECFKCGLAIEGNVVRFENMPYHIECFICQQCRTPLSGLEFYKQDEKPYCEPCYMRYFGKRCATCYKAIKGNTKFIDYGGEFHHDDCFVCSMCYCPLAGAKFVVRSGNRLCTNCK
eukprot:gene7250-8058_t